MRRSLALAVLCLLATQSIGAAQSPGDIAAWQALRLTPVGALPPLATPTIEAEVQNGASFALRYGYIAGVSGAAATNNVGATAMLPLGMNSTVSLTGGAFMPTCSGCSAGAMFSAGGDIRLTEMPFGGTGATDGSRITLSLNGELGYARPRGSDNGSTNVWSGMVGVPIGWVSGDRSRDGMRIVPFITPGLGFGTINNATEIVFVNGSGPIGSQTVNTSESGMRFVLGGGLALYNRSSSVAFHVGFQYVSIPNANAQIGVGLVLGGR